MAWVLIVLAPVVYIALLVLYLPATALPSHVAYDTFKRDLAKHSIAWVTTAGTGEYIRVGLTNGQETVTRRPAFGDPELERDLENANVQVNPVGHSSLAWDIVVSATPFGTLSAVLAGFVFIGIIGILTLPPHSEDKPRPKLADLIRQVQLPLLTLVQAFLTLVDAAYLFAVLAGESTGAGRVAPIFEGFCPSWLLALGVVQMAGAIAWILDRYELDWSVVRMGRWIVHFAIGLAVFSTAGVLVTPIYDVPSVSAQEAAFLWFVAAAPVLLSIWLGFRWNKRSSITPLDLTLPVVGAVGLVTGIYVALTALLGESDFVQHFRLFFLLAVVAQVILAGLSAVYEASLPRQTGEVEKVAAPSRSRHTTSVTREL